MEPHAPRASELNEKYRTFHEKFKDDTYWRGTLLWWCQLLSVLIMKSRCWTNISSLPMRHAAKAKGFWADVIFVRFVNRFNLYMKMSSSLVTIAAYDMKYTNMNSNLLDQTDFVRLCHYYFHCNVIMVLIIFPDIGNTFTLHFMDL